MEDKIQSYRQPFVTATGIILGFIFNYIANFAKSENSSNTILAALVSVCVIAGVVCLIVVLKRILAMDYPKENTEHYYKQTLNLFLIGISIAFSGILIDVLASVIN